MCTWGAVLWELARGRPSQDHCPTPSVPADTSRPEPLWLTPRPPPSGRARLHVVWRQGRSGPVCGGWWRYLGCPWSQHSIRTQRSSRAGVGRWRGKEGGVAERLVGLLHS